MISHCAHLNDLNANEIGGMCLKIRILIRKNSISSCKRTSIKPYIHPSCNQTTN